MLKNPENLNGNRCFILDHLNPSHESADRGLCCSVDVSVLGG